MILYPPDIAGLLTGRKIFVYLRHCLNRKGHRLDRVDWSKHPFGWVDTLKTLSGYVCDEEVQCTVAADLLSIMIQFGRINN